MSIRGRPDAATHLRRVRTGLFSLIDLMCMGYATPDLPRFQTYLNQIERYSIELFPAVDALFDLDKTATEKEINKTFERVKNEVNFLAGKYVNSREKLDPVMRNRILDSVVETVKLYNLLDKIYESIYYSEDEKEEMKSIREASEKTIS